MNLDELQKHVAQFATFTIGCHEPQLVSPGEKMWADRLSKMVDNYRDEHQLEDEPVSLQIIDGFLSMYFRHVYPNGRVA
jgi:hypothetical protein